MILTLRALLVTLNSRISSEFHQTMKKESKLEIERRVEIKCKKQLTEDTVDMDVKEDRK